MPTHRSILLTSILALGCAAPLAAAPDTPARVEVSLVQSAAANPAIGVNEFGDPGRPEFSAGNLIPNTGFEPISFRRLLRVRATGVENGRRWFEAAGGGINNYDLVTTGLFNGAEARVYRLVDAQGNPLPQTTGDTPYLDLTNAARYTQVGTTTIPEAGAPGLPVGGWIDSTYTQPNAIIGTRTSLDYTDAIWIQNGKTYHYIVTAIATLPPTGPSAKPGRIESDLALATEHAATPQAGLPCTPRIYIKSGDSFNEIPEATPEKGFGFEFRVAGATGPVTWELLDSSNNPISFPGMKFESHNQGMWDSPTTVIPPTPVRLRATTSAGVVTRDFILNNPVAAPVGETPRPIAPPNVTVTAYDGYVHLAWDPSPSPNVIGYRVYRAELPRAQQCQRAYLADDALELVRDDYVFLSKRCLEPDLFWSHPRVRNHFSDAFETAWGSALTMRRVPHPLPLPPESAFPGESCLEVIASEPKETEIAGEYIFHSSDGSGDARWYSQLEPGKTYRYEAWMRQDGLADSGQVGLGITGYYANCSHTFTVDNQWRLHGFEFVAPPRHTSGSHDRAVIHFTGPGSLWIDNIRLFRIDTPSEITEPLTPPSQLVYNELMSSQPLTGEKGILRSMTVLLNDSSMTSNLRPYRDAGLLLDGRQVIGNASNMTLPTFLQYAFKSGATPATRMKPWLNVSSFISEGEWLMLLEYLSAPIDPSNPADVAAKPWAYLRYLERGTPTPWTDEFSRVYLEFANETWHNGAVSPQWTGWGPDGEIHNGAREFGFAAHYLTSYVAAHSPYFPALHASGKLCFVLGSNPSNYAEIAAQGAPLARGIAHTTYVGPRWEVNEPQLDEYNDHGVQATLLAHIGQTAAEFSNFRRWREELAAAGHPTELLAYEGGPGGYGLPSPFTSPTLASEFAERYGKSLAMAVSALDAWLGAYEAGFSDMGYFAMGIGDGFSSHTQIDTGYRPQPGWLAMTLRNRFASGRMIRTTIATTPSIEWDGIPTPLVSAHAFRDGKRLCVFLLSRKLGGIHDDVDWGDGSTPVTLTLPANPTGPATLYHLSGDPRATNRFAMDVTIQQTTVTLGRETTVSLPQGSIYLYVFDTDLPDRDDPLPSPGASPTFTYAPTGTTLAWPAVPGATGYTIYRSSHPAFDYGDVSKVFTTTSPGLFDDEGVSGATYFYRVAANNGWGAGFWTFVAAGGTNPHAAVIPAPTIQGVIESTGALIASWHEVPGATGYRVGLAANPEGPYTWTDAGIATSWTYSGLQAGETYYVQAYACNALGRGPASETRSGSPLAFGSEYALAAWDAAGLNYSDHLSDPPSSVPVARYLAAVTTTSITRGPGLRVNTASYGFDDAGPDKRIYDGKFASEPNHNNANFGAPGGGSLANAVERDLYIGCTVTPLPGQLISISSIDTGFQYGSNALNLVLRYRIGAGPWHDVPAPDGYLIRSGSHDSRNDVTFPLAGESALQNATEPVELRFYFYYAGEDASWAHVSLIRTTGDELIIRGTAQTVAAPGQPVGVRTVVGANQIGLAWSPVGGSESYTVRWGTAPGVYTDSVTGLPQATATVTGLPNGVPHYFVVEAVNSFGTSPRSAEIAATPQGESAFQAWQSAHFTPAQLAAGLGAMAADPDADSQSNLVEYAFGTDPLATGATAYQIGTAGTPARLTATLPLWSTNNDITITLEASTDLTTWTPLARSTAGGAVLPLVSGVQVIGTSGTPGVFVIQDDPAHASVPRRFFRVSVSAP